MTELKTMCKLCGKDDGTPLVKTVEIREHPFIICEKCDSKLIKKFKGKEFKTKKERTSYLDSLDTIHRLKKKGHMSIRVDSREQCGWEFGRYKNIGVVHNGMKTGDYQLVGMESFVTVDRKSLGDFVGTMIKGKARFARELGRMQGYKYKYVFIEATLEDIYEKKYIVKKANGKFVNTFVDPNSLFGLFLSFEMKYNVKFLFLSDRNTCVRRLVALYDQIIRQEETELKTPKSGLQKIIEKGSYVLNTITIESLVRGFTKQPEKFRKLIDSMEGKEHKYLIVKKSWAELVKEEGNYPISTNSIMQSVARLEIEYNLRVKFISDERIIARYFQKVKEFSEKNIVKRNKVLKGFECELEKKDKAYIV